MGILHTGQSESKCRRGAETGRGMGGSHLLSRKQSGRLLGLQLGSRSFTGHQKSRCSEPEVCPALEMGHKTLPLVITLVMGKAPNLNSFTERLKFLMNPQGLDCLQLKINHVIKSHLLWRPVLNPFNRFAMTKARCAS